MKNLKKYSVFLTPAGAGIAIICFFLPWVRVSCGTITVEASGARIGGVFWAVLAISIVILVSFFYFWKKRDMATMRLATLIGGILSLILMMYRFIHTFGGGSSNTKISDVAATIRYGAWGEFFGFILAMLGTVFMAEGKIGKWSEQNISRRRRFSYLIGRKQEDEISEPPLSGMGNERPEQKL